MAQTLGYIEKELKKVERAAAETEAQMLALERAVQAVIIAGAKGSGASSLTQQGAGVQNVARNAINNPYFNPSGSPVGGRAVVGSEVDTSAIKGAAAEYAALKPVLVQQKTQLGVLNSAYDALIAAAWDEAHAMQEAASKAGEASRSEEAVALMSRNKRIAADKAAIDAQSRLPKSLGERVAAWKEEEKATKALAKKTEEAAQKMGELVKGVDQAASELADTGTNIRTGKGAGKGKGQPQAKVYSQADLQNIFGSASGTATKISEVASKSNFKPEDIKRVTEYANSYTQLQYAAQGANGVMRKLVLTTDKAGNVMTSTQKQFRTFFGAIRRNVTEMIKWSAATLVVWGAIRKMGELLEIAIANETKLADIAVILGAEHANLTTVFNSAAEAAAATGESIDGVLEGYVQAFRATGNIADATERAAASQALLTDALTLSKLSALTTAQAMDVLTGAMRQAGLDFDEGAVLLDKWVAVSRQANVSIETLAESFAITATSASNAGLEWDELNGIIATLAESTTLSATESGNAIRAFISGFNTDTAVKELTKYGISVRDSSGETRGFLDVMKEIAALFEQGIISEGQLNKISRAIGGGARREAQVATTIKNLGRAQEVAAVSANANGDAQRALGIQLDTVQTAITKLNNSFQKLARTMGSDGGVLDVAGGVLNVFTKLVDATSAITKNLGDMTPILAALGVMFAVTSKETRGLFATNIVGGIAGFLNTRTGAGGSTVGIEEQRLNAGVQGGFATQGGAVGLGTKVSQKLLGPGYGRNSGSLLGQGLAAGFTGVSAIRDLTQGNEAGAVGSVAGGLIGALLTGGSPIGIVIGTAAGEAFANATVNYETQFTNFFTDIFTDALPAAKAGLVSDEETAIAATFTEFGLGSEALGKFFAKIGASGGNIGVQGGNVIGNVLGGVGIGDYKFKEDQASANITPEQIALGFIKGTEASENVFALRAEQEAQKGFDAKQKPGEFKFAIIDDQKELLDEYNVFLTDLEQAQAEIYRAGAMSGDISDKELKDALDQIPNLQSILTKYEAAFGVELRALDDNINSVTESFVYQTKVVLNGSTEQVAHLNTLANEIAIITNLMDDAKEAGRTTIRLGRDDLTTPDVDESRELTFAEAEAEAQQLRQRAALTTQASTRAINKEQIKLPTVIDLDLKAEDFDKFKTEIEKVRDQTFEGFWEQGLLTDYNAAEIEEIFAPFFLSLGKSGAGKVLEGFSSQMASQAFSNLVTSGAIVPEKKDEKIGLQQFDISSGEFPAVMAEYQKLVGSVQGQLGAQGIEWSPNEETFAGLFTDYVAMPITADLTLLNIAMQELIDVSKDQLDGIYNLPTDASFYVPFSGYKEGFVNQGGGGGTGDALQGYMSGLKDEEPLEEITKIVRPDRWRIEQDARIQNQRDREAVVGGDKYDYPGEGERFGDKTLADYGYEKPLGTQLPGARDLFDQFVRPMIEAMGGQMGSVDPLGIQTGERGTGLRGQLDPNQGFLGDLLSLDKPLEPLPGGTFGSEIVNTFRDLINSLFGLNGEDSTITTKLQIESTTNTIVQLDGQVIANAIKPYLLNDEVRYEGTAGAAVKRFVI